MAVARVMFSSRAGCPRRRSHPLELPRRRRRAALRERCASAHSVALLPPELKWRLIGKCWWGPCWHRPRAHPGDEGVGGAGEHHAQALLFQDAFGV